MAPAAAQPHIYRIGTAFDATLIYLLSITPRPHTAMTIMLLCGFSNNIRCHHRTE